MGCDGGTIPTRDELVSLKKKPEKKDKNSVINTKWKLCNISSVPLKQPIVACQLGRLYNKESILELLLDRAKIDKTDKFIHIRSLKDVTSLQLTPNPGFQESEVATSESYVDHQASEYICNVSGLEMNGRHKFSFIIGCGCVISDRALSQVKSTNCHKCGKPFDVKNDVVMLLGNDSDIKTMAANMKSRKLKAKQDKKAKRKCKEIEDSKFKAPIPVKVAKLQESEDTPSTSAQTKKKISKKSEKELPVNAKKDIQSDEKTSKVYKSLFNTCDAAKNSKKGNWVTFNPQYF